MKKLALLVGISLAFNSGTTLAASLVQEHQHNQPQQMTTTSVSTHTGVGVLKAINVNANKVQITHEAITTLGWPAMTMWFTLRGPLPSALKVGDSVRFELTQPDGKHWVIETLSVQSQ